jgi:hypothetical protein
MSAEILPWRITTKYPVNVVGAPGIPGEGRNVFILLDGTWNEERDATGSPAISNVRKLYDSLGEDGPGQIARYFRGVGNRQDNSWLARRWHGFTGGDEKRIRESAYATIVKEYKPGDNLIILGFSRGAACARRLAAHLQAEGIPEEIEITSTYSANRLTRQVENRFVSYRKFGRIHPAAVSFLGCWDTVGAFVMPLRFPSHPRLNRAVSWIAEFGQRLGGDVPFRDLTVSSNVGRAVHCVAIDETRNAFLPTLINHEPRVEEVWFPGVHADVGGGYLRDTLGRVTLRFMVDRLNRHVANSKLRPISWTTDRLDAFTEIDETSTFDFHFHGLARGLRLRGKSIRCIRVRINDDLSRTVKPAIHWSVADLWQSDQIFAEDERRRIRWRVDYRPFNVRELNEIKSDLNAAPEEWPFHWIDRPDNAHV